MFVAGFTPAIGYEQVIRIACVAFVDAIGLREACLKLGFLTDKEFGCLLCPVNMADS